MSRKKLVMTIYVEQHQHTALAELRADDRPVAHLIRQALDIVIADAQEPEGETLKAAAQLLDQVTTDEELRDAQRITPQSLHPALRAERQRTQELCRILRRVITSHQQGTAELRLRTAEASHARTQVCQLHALAEEFVAAPIAPNGAEDPA